MKKVFSLLIILYFVVYILNTSPAYAQTPTPCVRVFGGGQSACIPVRTPTPTPRPELGFPTTTKGGLRIQQPSTQTTAPATGPEALALVGLLGTGAVGFFLRKLSK